MPFLTPFQVLVPHPEKPAHKNSAPLENIDLALVASGIVLAVVFAEVTSTAIDLVGSHVTFLSDIEWYKSLHYTK